MPGSLTITPATPGALTISAQTPNVALVPPFTPGAAAVPGSGAMIGTATGGALTITPA